MYGIQARLLEMQIGIVMVINGVCVTRWTEHSWEIGTFMENLTELADTTEMLCGR